MPQTLSRAGRETSGGVALASRIVRDAWAAAPWAFRQAVHPAGQWRGEHGAIRRV